MSGNGQALLGMPDIDMLDFLTINCLAIDMQAQNYQIYNKMEDECQCTSKTHEADQPEKLLSFQFQ